METTGTPGRDYSTISPSARSLLSIKALTSIPYAKQAAALLHTSGQDELGIGDNKNPMFWGRVVHFESRYWSIDQLLKDQPVKNILELSSGFSFRGPVWVQEEGMHYIDTDLPEVIAAKKQFLSSMQIAEQPGRGSELELLPLNALDEAAFKEMVGRFPEGPLAIVNEGLLMYLGNEEKKKLCRIIREVLLQRGGYWITADIYIKKELNDISMYADDKLSKFFEQHNIYENMFESFEAAEAFFKNQGFILEQEAEPDYEKLTALQHLLQYTTEEQLQQMRQAGKIQATWRLRPVGE